MLRTLAILIGIGLILIGIMGFFPNFVEQGQLFGLLKVNLEHNMIHISAGIVALLCGLTSKFATKNFFIIAGVIFALLAVFGFLDDDELLFEMIAINPAGNVLHATLAVVFLLLGLSSSD